MNAVGHDGRKAMTLHRSSRALMQARIRKAFVVGIVTFSNGLALFAFGATADRWWVAVFALVPAAFATVGVRASAIPDAPLPGTAAVMVAVLTLLFQLLSFALFAGLLGWIVDAVLSLVNIVGGFDINSESIGFWIGFGLMLMVFAAFAVTAARNLVTGLYPAAGLHSPYVGFFRGEGPRLWARAGAIAVFVAGVIAFALLSDLPGRDWGTALFLALLACSSIVTSPQLISALRDEPKVTEDGLAKAFRECGWTVVPSPQTGRAAIDPLLADVDLFAYKDAQSVLVQLKQDAAGAETAWSRATSVLTAARALPRTELPPGVETPDAVVVLVNTETVPALEKFASSEALSIISLDTTKHTGSVLAIDRLRGDLKAVADLVVAEETSEPSTDTAAGLPS
jgi:hypothetical protein